MIIAPLQAKDDTFHQKDWNFSASSGNITTTGDELLIPNGFSITRSNFSVNGSNTNNLYVAARAPFGTATLQVTVKSTTNFTLNNTLIVSNNMYTLFPIPLAGSGKTWSTVILSSSGNTSIVDFVAFDFNTNVYPTLDIGGTVLEIKVDMKAIPKRIPMGTDVIQQMGIYSRTFEVTTPKQLRSIYNQIEVWVTNNIPVLLQDIATSLSPAFLGTGYLQEINASTEAGWVASGGALYDIIIDFIKADSIAP